MGNQPSVEDHCHRLKWWEDAVKSTTSVKTYQEVVHFMFEDGKINRGRLKVLEVFTKDVCHHYPQLTSEVWDQYEKILSLRNTMGP